MQMNGRWRRPRSNTYAYSQLIDFTAFDSVNKYARVQSHTRPQPPPSPAVRYNNNNNNDNYCYRYARVSLAHTTLGHRGNHLTSSNTLRAQNAVVRSYTDLSFYPFSSNYPSPVVYVRTRIIVYSLVLCARRCVLR